MITESLLFEQLTYNSLYLLQVSAFIKVQNLCTICMLLINVSQKFMTS
jgi:hypothetical protein